MYERNAIVIERYFAELFGYTEHSNLKNNYKNYCNLVNKLEKYQEVSETEDNMMVEFEKTANEIKETQKIQESLNKRNMKLQESRKVLFENLDETADNLRKKISKIEEELSKNNEEITSNTEKFISEIEEFHEKSENRTKCGRERRIVENEYQKVLEETATNFNNIDQEKVKKAKVFLKQESDKELKTEIKDKIIKNGEKEKIPFDENVISKAIDIATDLEERKLEILISVYEKTMRMLVEIKNEAVKIDRHKKAVRDAESKLNFLNTVDEYVVLFLDNERMSVIGGEREHKKIMGEACINVKSDLEQIKNMYDLVLKEATNKASKKAYKELYSPEYMQELLDGEKEFEENVSKLNMIGTVIYPNYWRVEGMQKIFDIFRHIISDVYEQDLSEYEPIDTSNMEDDSDNEDNLILEEDDDDDLDDLFSEISDESDDEEFEEDMDFDLDDDINEDEEDDKDYDYFDDDFSWDDDNYEEDIDDDSEENDEDRRDKKIDEILGFYGDDDELFDEEEDDYDKIDFDSDDDFDDYNFEEEELDEKVEDVKKKKNVSNKRKRKR